jgi:hypothetical protein
MLGEKYLNWTDRLLAQNRLLGVALLVMLIWNLCTFAFITRIQSKTQVVVVPLGSGDGLQVGHGRASEPYLRRMARYIVGQVGTYTAATARDQLLELLDLFPPDTAGSAQSVFERMASEIERYPSITSTVRWTGKEPLKYDRNTIQIAVRKARLVNGSETESKTVHYCLGYRIDETRFQLTSLTEREETGDNICFDDARVAR